MPSTGPSAIGTYPQSIDGQGEIRGFFDDLDGVSRCFIRQMNGHLETFEVPGANLTVCGSINARGEAAGYFGADEHPGESLCLKTPTIPTARVPHRLNQA